MALNNNLLDYFEETVEKHPEKVAVQHKEESISFALLKKKSQGIACHIVTGLRGMKNRPVAVLLDKSIDLVAADLAVMYSCNIFMNLDVKTPALRLENIIKTILPAAIITEKKYATSLTDFNDIPIFFTEDWNGYPETPEDGDINVLQSRRESMIDTDPLCIINTSGSTGTPKGVVLNHRSFFDFIRWSSDTFHLNGQEIIGSLSPAVFDIFDFELCCLIKNGASLVLLDSEMAIFPARLLEELTNKKVNFIFWVPTIMVNIANMRLLERIPLNEIKTIWFAGEVFPTKQFNYWRKHLPQAVFANLYGPIEITLDCCYYIVDREFSDEEPLPIGRACKNTDILLLNAEDQQCQRGEEGELCVRGTSLAMGYYNDPDKTREVFVQNPLNHSYPELIYRTGDVAYENNWGELIFKGRRDTIIKHKGYRIELGEIEHVLVNSLKLVKNCCVTYDFNKKEIILFYENESNCTPLDIKKGLQTALPRYMIPTVYKELKELPRNTNGKIDRLALSGQLSKENKK